MWQSGVSGRVEFGFGRVRTGKFDKKKFWVMVRVRVDLIQVRLGFGSNTIGFFRISGHSGQAGSDFWFLVAHVILGFESFGFGSGRVSDHLISGSLRFQVILGRVGFFFVMFYF
jgi:hypothetical protein